MIHANLLDFGTKLTFQNHRKSDRFVNASNIKKKHLFPGAFLWAHLDLNQGPTDYESAALTD